MSYQETSSLPHQLRSLVESELQVGESITWMDQPVPVLMAQKALPAVLGGIVVTAFALFWTYGAAGGTSKMEHKSVFSIVFSLFGLVPFLVGLGLLSGPYWALQSARRSVYVLTDRRAITFIAGWRGTLTIRSFKPEQLTDLHRKQNNDGSGDLVFTQDIQRDNDSDSRSTDIGFLAIREVKVVEDLVRTLAQTSVK